MERNHSQLSAAALFGMMEMAGQSQYGLYASTPKLRGGKRVYNKSTSIPVDKMIERNRKATKIAKQSRKQNRKG